MYATPDHCPTCAHPTGANTPHDDPDTIEPCEGPDPGTDDLSACWDDHDHYLSTAGLN